MSDSALAAPRSLPLWSRLPLAFGVGLVMALGHAPYDLWYLGFAGVVAAFWLFQSAPKGLSAAGTGWMIGLGYFGLSLGWIVEPFFVDAATTGWMAPFALLGMGGGMALFWGLSFWVAGHAGRRAGAALAISWTAAELARAYVLTGFPWGLVSYLWASVDVIQWVALVGPHGLNFLTFAAAALVTSSLPRDGLRSLPMVLGVTLLLILFGAGKALVPAEADLSDRPIVRLIQPNAPQHEKWDPLLIPEFFDRSVNFTAAPGEQGAPKLVVWPETALPMLLHRAGNALSVMSGAAGNAQIVTGVQRRDGPAFFNSLAVVDDSGRLSQVYDKHHLVPFGEYMPAAAVFARWNIAGLASRAAGGYSAGPGPRLVDFGDLGRALPLICYEAVFPQDVYRAPDRPEFLLQITNDAWFGEWSGPYQHLAQARIRAIEQGLPFLRAANTGVSAVIDGGGRVIASLDLGQAGYVDAPLPAPARLTLYSTIGDLPVLFALFAACFGLFRPFQRNKD
jgi:apolipoprotein N-acyltransferase